MSHAKGAMLKEPGYMNQDKGTRIKEPGYFHTMCYMDMLKGDMDHNTNIFVVFVCPFQPSCCCCLPTPRTLASGGSPACGPTASFSANLASSVVPPAGSVHISSSDNVVRMWVKTLS